MLEFISHSIIQFIESTSYLGIFVLMAIESALIPIPSEVTMPFAGFLSQKGVLNMGMVILVGTLANLAGSLFAYWIGYVFQEKLLLKLISKYGKFILVSDKEYKIASKWFKKYGEKIVFIGRLLPGIRTMISLPAGVFKMNLGRFIIYTVLGCFIWSSLLTYIGYVLGANWESLSVYYNRFELVILGGLIIAIMWYVNYKLNLRRKLFKS